jgi:putative flavoprotein involved in K+ transport
MSSHYDVIVIGGGQAGLAMGWHLARQGRDFLILDAAARAGDAWRTRWSSLRLFTPARYDALPGMEFPAAPEHFPTKDEVADYLERYAWVFGLPVHSSERVLSLRGASMGAGFEVETDTCIYEADQVVVATGPFQTPRVPAVAGALGPEVTQLHSSLYRSPEQLPDGPVVVVGAANSGVQIAAELAPTRPTWLAVGQKLSRLPATLFGASIFTWLENGGAMNISVDTALGRRASHRDVLIGESPRRVARSLDVKLAGRVTGAEGNRLTMADGATAEAASVIWATGFGMDFDYVNVPVFDELGRPVHRRGVTAVPGVYFLGLPWQHTWGSALLGWVGRDAAFLAERITEAAPPRSWATQGLSKCRSTEDARGCFHERTQGIARSA